LRPNNRNVVGLLLFGHRLTLSWVGRRPRDHAGSSHASGPGWRIGPRVRVVPNEGGGVALLGSVVAGKRLRKPEVRRRTRRANPVRDIAERQAGRRAHVPWRHAERADPPATALGRKSEKIRRDQGNGVQGVHGTILRELPGTDSGSRPHARTRCDCLAPKSGHFPIPLATPIAVRRVHGRQVLAGARSVGGGGNAGSFRLVDQFGGQDPSCQHSSPMTSTRERDYWVVAAEACIGIVCLD